MEHFYQSTIEKLVQIVETNQKNVKESVLQPKLQIANVDTSELEDFYTIAARTGTDKVTTHQYHHLYDKYPPPPSPFFFFCDFEYRHSNFAIRFYEKDIYLR